MELFPTIRLYKKFFPAAFLLLILSYPLYLKLKLDRASRQVELCFDLDSLVRFTGISGSRNSHSNILELTKAGVTSFAVYEQTLEEALALEDVTVVSPGSVHGLNCIPRSTAEYLLYSNGKKVLSGFRDLLFAKYNINTPLLECIGRHTEKHFYFTLSGQLNLSEIHTGDYNVPETVIKNNIAVYARPVNSRLIFPGAAGYFLGKITSLPGIAGVVFAKDEVLGYPSLINITSEKLGARGIPCGLVEFSNQKGLSELTGRMGIMPPVLHSISHAETESLSDKMNGKSLSSYFIDRYIRAVEERGVRMIYLRMIETPGRDFSGSYQDVFAWNAAFISALKKRLDTAGYSTGKPVFLRYSGLPAIFRSVSVTVRQMLAFSLFLFIPILSLHYGLKRFSGNFFAITLFNMLLSISLYIILSRYEFFIRIAVFRGVKAGFVLSVIFVFLYLFKDKLKSMLYSEIKTYQAVIILAGLTLFLLMLMRSGNQSPAGIFPGEEKLRLFLELVFGARPRLKEFLFGYPLLYIGLAMSREEKYAGKTLPAVLLFAGSIGLISTANTFCHIHTPVLYSIRRTINGILLGALIGFILNKLRNSTFSKKGCLRFL